MNQNLNQAQLLDRIRGYLGNHNLEVSAENIAAALRADGQIVSDHFISWTLANLRREVTGLGPLEDLLNLPGLTDIIVNGAQQIYVDQGAGLMLSEPIFASETEVRRLAVRLAAQAGRRLDDASPYVDARLPSGIRLHAILGGLAACGTCLSLRIPAAKNFTLGQWVDYGSMTVRAADLLSGIVENKIAFLVSGGTGSGKTTLLNTLLSEIPKEQRILIVEDSRELNPNHPHVIKLEARPPNMEGKGAVTLTHLVRQALRMRPDRIVLGEVRGAEICDLLLALNTGHEGGCGTVHANSARDVPSRLEALAGLGGLGFVAVHSQIASALQVVIQVNRYADGFRHISEIGVFDRSETDKCQVLPAISWDKAGKTLLHSGYERLEAWCA